MTQRIRSSAAARPVRLQLSRKKGFNLQALSRDANGLEAVKVDRSTGFGNPFPIHRCGTPGAPTAQDKWSIGTWAGPAMWFRDSEADARELSVKAFKAWAEHPAQSTFRDRARLALRGKNLGCWCGDGPCHADVLLEIANAD